MKNIFILFLALFFLSSCTHKSGTTSKISPTNSPVTTTLTPSSITNNATSDTIVALNTKNGQIVIKLYKDIAPNTVNNFLNKVNSGFYNGLTFHRVIDGFMAQGGDPTGSGTGGGSQKSEINNLPFKRGSLGLARTPVSKEISNDSQFFICFTTEGCQHLTNDYVNFGEVISGFDNLDKIQLNDSILDIYQYTK